MCIFYLPFHYKPSHFDTVSSPLQEIRSRRLSQSGYQALHSPEGKEHEVVKQFVIEGIVQTDSDRKQQESSCTSPLPSQQQQMQQQQHHGGGQGGSRSIITNELMGLGNSIGNINNNIAHTFIDVYETVRLKSHVHHTL